MAKSRLKSGDKDRDSHESNTERPLTLADLSSEDSSDDAGPLDADSGSSEAEESASESSDKESGKAPEQREKKVPNGKHSTSAQDVRVAREVSELFKSNVFKLQVDEVIKEITMEPKYEQQATKILFEIKKTLSESGTMKPANLAKARSLVQCRVPFPDPVPHHDSINYKFAYEPPADINIVGSYCLKTHIKRPEGTGIDMVLVMPSNLFEEKDFVNYRYFHKRAYYLAVVADIIASRMSELNLSKARFQYLHDDPLRPVLRVDFAHKSLAKRMHLIIHLGIQRETFNIRKLAADRNNVRSQSQPTPWYNSSLLADMAHGPMLNYLWKAKRDCAGFSDAVKLGCLWLKQTGMGSSPSQGGFGDFEFAILMAALLQGGLRNGKKVLMNGYSSYQLLKGLVLWLSSEELELQFGTNSHTVPTSSGKLLFTDLGLDVLAHVPRWGIKALKLQAAIACDLLGDSARDRFSSLFLKNSSRLDLKYDWSCEVALPVPDDSHDRATWPRYHDYIADRIGEILEIALQPRYRCLTVSAPQSESWSLSSAIPASAESTGTYTVGLWLDASEAEKRVTFALPDQVGFKEFWGSKASLRRFQDGNIKEAVVWKHGIRPIVEEAAKYALALHLDASVEGHVVVDQFLPSQPQSELAITSTMPFHQHIQAFQKLSQTLQELRELPLRISSVYGISPSLRFASITSPVPFDPVTGLGSGAIDFESSSNWPTDPAALEKTKTAFLIRIAELMRKHAPAYHSVVGVEALGELERGFLTVATPTGYSFKLYIKNGSQELTQLVDHSRFIASVAQRFYYYSSSVRVLKIWFQRHLLLSYVSEPAVELLTAKVFLDSAPWEPPVSSTTAFYRVMDLLSTWNWKEEPLVLDTARSSEEIGSAPKSLVTGTASPPSLIQELNGRFEKQREQDPVLTQAPWVILSKVDKSGIAWTGQKERSRTGLLIASRVTALSRGVIEIGDDIQLFFTPSLQDYDVEFSVDNSQAAKSSSFPKNVVVGNPEKAIIDGSFNPGLSFFRDIQHAYKDCLVLFYTGCPDDRRSRQSITGIWTLSASEQHKFKVGISYPTKQVEPGQYTVDKAAVLAEIERLGQGIVSLIRS